MDTDYDIGRVAKMSGLTSRTLRHYGDIGLLAPAWTGPDGRRRYGQPELLRLQHILVLRELGTSLDRIASIVDSDDPSTTIALLRDHLEGLSLIHISEPTRLRRISYAVFC